MELKLNNLNNAHSKGRGLRQVKGGTLYRQKTVFVQDGQKERMVILQSIVPLGTRALEVF